MTTAAERRTEQQEAAERLREVLRPGDRVRTVLRHVSASGMTRWIDVYKLEGGDALYLTGNVATATGYRTDPRYGHALKVEGCGMDMGFAVVYNLGRTLWPDGFDCIGRGEGHWTKGCPANDHYNDRQDDYRPDRRHSDGGYALRQEWL